MGDTGPNLRELNLMGMDLKKKRLTLHGKNKILGNKCNNRSVRPIG
jgi:hypothetical protein